MHPLDGENMEQIMMDSPQQFRDGLRVGRAETTWKEPGPITHLCLSGMGGSWMAGALLAEAGMLRVPLTVHRSYGLPESMGKETLVIASSFSGNTEETLSAYDEARTRGVPLIALAAGGALEQRAQRERVPFFRIPADPPTMQPRNATGYTVGILGGVLSRVRLAQEDAPQALEGLADALERRMPATRERGEALASALTATTPIIYASSVYATVARIWKIKINENAKTPAFWNVFPELNHNEMIGWTSPRGPFHILLLHDTDDHPRTQKRMMITKDLLHEKGIPVIMVPIEGGTRLEKIFSTLLVGDWLSYRLALGLGTDPSPVAMVEDLKKRLRG